MGNAVSEAQKTTAQNFVPSTDANNNAPPKKSPHNFANTAGMNPPPECPMHVKTDKTDDSKKGGCAVAGGADDLNPLNMVGTNRCM